MRFRKSAVVAVASVVLSAGFAANHDRDETSEWRQPKIGCVEGLFPKLPTENECAAPLDPKSDLAGRCKALADYRAEVAKPGEQIPMNLWLPIHMQIDREKKIDLIYSSAEKYGMPPQILYGVVHLEALISDLGVIRDGDNFSCGTGSVNIWQWCRWMKSEPPEFQTAMGWPVGISCDEDTLPPEIVGAVFNHADFSHSVTVPARPGYDDWHIQMHAREADAVSDATILDDLKENHASVDSSAPDSVRLQAIRSFTRNCSAPEHAIPAIAYSLRDVFDRLIPKALRKQQRYSGREKFERSCARPYVSKFYPLHSGWLLAYGIHNQGEDLGNEFKKKKQGPKLHRRRLFSARDLEDALSAMGARAEGNINHVLTRMTFDGNAPFKR